MNIDDAIDTACRQMGSDFPLGVSSELSHLAETLTSEQREQLRRAAEARGFYVSIDAESYAESISKAVLVYRDYAEKHQAAKPVLFHRRTDADTTIENPCDDMVTSHGKRTDPACFIHRAITEQADAAGYRSLPLIHRRLIGWADKLAYRDDRQVFMAAALAAGYDVSPEGLAEVERFCARQRDPDAPTIGPLYMLTERRLRTDGTLEPDLIAGRENAPLVFLSLDETEITTLLPLQGWTRAKINAAALQVLYKFPDAVACGASAYLGGGFIGSTEC